MDARSRVWITLLRTCFSTPHRTQESGLLIDELVKRLSWRTDSSRSTRNERDGERTAHCVSSCSLSGSACLFSTWWDKRKTGGGTITSSELVTQVSDLIALCWLGAQAHRRPWVSLGWVRRSCRYSERASCFISATYSWKGIVWPCNPLIGTDLMSPPGCQISKRFSAAFTQQVTRWPARDRLT
jgi:hypothetical protein